MEVNAEQTFLMKEQMARALNRERLWTGLRISMINEEEPLNKHFCLQSGLLILY